MTEESTLSEDGLAKRIADFAASFAANQKALADLAQIGNPNMVAMLAEAALSDRGDASPAMLRKTWLPLGLRH